MYLSFLPPKLCQCCFSHFNGDVLNAFFFDLYAKIHRDLKKLHLILNTITGGFSLCRSQKGLCHPSAMVRVCSRPAGNHPDEVAS